MQGGTSSRRSFLTICFWERICFQAGIWCPIPGKGTASDLPIPACFLLAAQGGSFLGPLPLAASSASIWLLHLSHWLWASANRGFCPPFPKKIIYLLDQLAEWTCLATTRCLDLMQSWEEKREEERRKEKNWGEDQDKCINRDVNFRGNLPLLPRKNNIKMSPVALAFLFLQFKGLNGWLSVLLPSFSQWCPACRTDGSAMLQLLSHPWHLQKACRWGWFSSIDPTTVCSGPVAALGAAQPSD